MHFILIVLISVHRLNVSALILNQQLTAIAMCLLDLALYGGQIVRSLLVILFSKRVKTEDYLDLTSILVEFDRIVDQMEQNLMVQVPIATHPVRYAISLSYFDADISVLNLVLEWLDKFEQSLTQG